MLTTITNCHNAQRHHNHYQLLWRSSPPAAPIHAVAIIITTRSKCRGAYHEHHLQCCGPHNEHHQQKLGHSSSSPPTTDAMALSMCTNKIMLWRSCPQQTPIHAGGAHHHHHRQVCCGAAHHLAPALGSLPSPPSFILEPPCCQPAPCVFPFKQHAGSALCALTPCLIVCACGVDCHAVHQQPQALVYFGVLLSYTSFWVHGVAPPQTPGYDPCQPGTPQRAMNCP